MKTRYLAAIAGTLLVMFFLFSKDKKARATDVDDDTDVSEVSARAGISNSIKQPVSQMVSTDASAAAAVPAPLPPPVPQMNENVLRQFSAQLKLLNRCLGLSNSPVNSEKTEPTMENLMTHLRASLGESIVQLDDWAQTEFVDKDSTKKRVRVDFDYMDGSTPTRRLSMYQINSYGMPEILSLSNDAVENPNDSYIASLIEGNKIMTEERGARAYFSQGEEVVFSTRNGVLQGVTVNRADKSFNCSNLDQENSVCGCP